MTSSDHPGPIRRVEEDAEFPVGGKCGMDRFVPPLCTPKGNTRRGWSGHLGSGIPEKPCYKAGTSIMRRVFRSRRRVESQATLWDLCRSSPDPGGNGRTAPNSSSHEALSLLPFSHAPWSLRRASSSMMSHSLCTHAVMLRTFLKVHTRPRLAYALRCRGY